MCKSGIRAGSRGWAIRRRRVDNRARPIEEPSSDIDSSDWGQDVDGDFADDFLVALDTTRAVSEIVAGFDVEKGRLEYCPKGKERHTASLTE